MSSMCLVIVIQGGSNMTGTDLCVNKPHMSRSYLNHLVIELLHYFTTIASVFIFIIMITFIYHHHCHYHYCHLSVLDDNMTDVMYIVITQFV